LTSKEYKNQGDTYEQVESMRVAVTTEDHTPPVFQLAEHILNYMTLSVEMFIARKLLFAVRFWMNTGLSKVITIIGIDLAKNSFSRVERHGQLASGKSSQFSSGFYLRWPGNI